MVYDPKHIIGQRVNPGVLWRGIQLVVLCVWLISLGIWLSFHSRLSGVFLKLPVDTDRLLLAVFGLWVISVVLPLVMSFLVWVEVMKTGRVIFIGLVEWGCLAVIALILGAVLIPGGFMTARRSGNSARMIVVLKKIHLAQEQYRTRPGQGNYASKLARLVTTPESSDGLTELEARLETVGYSGYQINFFRSFPRTDGAPPKYEIEVIPKTLSGVLRSGSFRLFIDQTGVIRRSESPHQPATAQSEPVE
ncbi:MAG TPA: hypothetical protein PLS70_21380 [Acidobacteriota bacterium]|nr:hypothetical protein [Acidobacteriota bacterium]